MSVVIPSNRTPLLCLWIALIVTFAVTRTITVRIRGGGSSLHNWNIGGVHVHHQVFGILIMLIAGSLQFAYAPTGAPANGLAAAFGIGAALTLDEFALWLRLDDVYWTEEGRVSIDAFFIAAALTGLFLAGVTPLNVPDLQYGIRWEASVAVLLNLGFIFIAMLKGKPVIGALGVMIPFIALIAAIRLAKPRSPWARRRYHEGSAKLARSRARFGPAYQARWNRLRDAIGRMTPADADKRQPTEVGEPSGRPR